MSLLGDSHCGWGGRGARTPLPWGDKEGTRAGDPQRALYASIEKFSSPWAKDSVVPGQQKFIQEEKLCY